MIQTSIRTDFSGTVSREVAQDKRAHLAEGFSKPSDIVGVLGIGPGMVIADFGAGSGAYTLAAAALVGEHGKVFAIDVQKELLTRLKNEAGRRGYGNVDIIWGDFEVNQGSRIKAESVDVVFVANVLFQCEHKLGAIREALRVLKPGGLLALVDWTDSFNSLVPVPAHVVTEAQARAYCETAGALFVSTFPAGEHHYGLLYKHA